MSNLFLVFTLLTSGQNTSRSIMRNNFFMPKLPFLPMGLAGAMGLTIFNALPFSLMCAARSLLLLLLLFDTPTLPLIFLFELFLLLIACPATTEAIKSLVVDVLFTVFITDGVDIVWIFCILFFCFLSLFLNQFFMNTNA